MKTQAVVLLSGALVALLLLSRYFALSRSGMPLGGCSTSGCRSPRPACCWREDLQIVHDNGAISDTEYSARRLQIISEM